MSQKFLLIRPTDDGRVDVSVGHAGVLHDEILMSPQDARRAAALLITAAESAAKGLPKDCSCAKCASESQPSHRELLGSRKKAHLDA